jgi:WD40 repeat protein
VLTITQPSLAIVGDSFFLSASSESIIVLMMALTECFDARYFAVGSADSLVSLWDVKELLCIKTFTKLE